MSFLNIKGTAELIYSDLNLTASIKIKDGFEVSSQIDIPMISNLSVLNLRTNLDAKIGQKVMTQLNSNQTKALIQKSLEDKLQSFN